MSVEYHICIHSFFFLFPNHPDVIIFAAKPTKDTMEPVSPPIGRRESLKTTAYDPLTFMSIIKIHLLSQAPGNVFLLLLLIYY